MKRGPLFKYFGSKFRSSIHYPPPKYNTIIEPFAGSAGYSLRYREKKCILVDIDYEIIGLWNWLITADPAEIIAMPVTNLVTGQDIRMLGLSDGAAELMRRWQRTGHCSSWTVSNITTGENKWCSRHGKGQSAGNTGMWHRNTRDYIAHAVTEIRHWHAIWEDYRMLDGLAFNPATWFIDPPYQNIKYASYKHNRSQINYTKLANWCKSLPGQVIVCEQEGANWLPFRPCCEVSGMRGKMRGIAGATSKEVVWTND